MATAKKAAPAKAAKPAPKAEPEAADAAPAAEAKVKTPGLKMKDLIARVATATGAKKKGLKEIVEATLTEVGDALSRGEDLNLPGLGRTRVARSAEKDGSSMLTLKVRRGVHKKHAETEKEPLAEDGEDS